MKKYNKISKLLKNIRSQLQINRTFVKTGKYGIKYLIIPNSALDFHIIKKGIFGDWAASKLEGIIPKTGVIFDVGANAGLLALIFAKKYVPKGAVYAYEPDAENFNQLKINVELNKLNNIKIFPIALQDNPKIKKVSFNIRRAIDGDGKENRGLSSLIPLAVHQIGKEKIFASTVDLEIEKSKILKIDFIKIDVEGAEYMVLKGGERAIEKFLPIIQYEYSNTLDKMMKTNNAKKCFYFLKKLGYRQFALFKEKELKEFTKPNPNIGDVNIICFPQDKISLVKKLK